MSVNIFNQQKNYHFNHNKLSDGNPFKIAGLPNYPPKSSSSINSPLPSYGQPSASLSNGPSNQLYNFMNKNESNKFTSNVSVPTSMNLQERVIAYGQDREENYFKRTLRKPSISNAIQSSSYNIISNLPYNLPHNSIPGTGTVFYDQMQNAQRKDQIASLFNYGSGLSSYNKLPPSGQGMGQNGNAGMTMGMKPGNSPLGYNGLLQQKMATPQKIGSGSLNESNEKNDIDSDCKNPEYNSSNSSCNSNSNKKQDYPFTVRTPSKQQQQLSQFHHQGDGVEKESPTTSSEYYEPHCSSVIEYAYKEDPNVRFRDYMEDRGKVVDCIKNNPNDGLFCLFDGHGGGEVSLFLQEKFASFFREVIPSQNLETTFTSLFNKVDQEIKATNYFHVGATACVVYITKEQGNRVLYCANIGDTRCVLVSTYSAKRLSYDHRASDKNEYSRIINSGGIVFAGRVYGQLMLSRAFGDWELKPYGVSNIPHVTRTELGPNDKYIVIATDGVWDVYQDDDMVQLSQTVQNADDFSKAIIKNSLSKGSMDNMSCYVVKLS